VRDSVNRQNASDAVFSDQRSNFTFIFGLIAAAQWGHCAAILQVIAIHFTYSRYFTEYLLK
jgi:hypothetical protein